MTPEQLRRIETIFHSARDLEPASRKTFLDEACLADERLRQEIEALLNSSEQGDGFVARANPKWHQALREIAAEMPAPEEASFGAGGTLSHYQLLEPLGRGGMGEVYLAADLRSGRKAALKLLPSRFTGDPERFSRFQQEARAVIALNHPNILTIYEIGEENSTHYIVSELIEGETLRERLLRQRVELDQAIDVALQVASALAAAHEAGIVHRDIKPENIMLRRDGYVKVLDFGIAKLAEQELPRNMATKEALLLAATNLGSILGTARYMAPEQARGDAVDKRADIWSLGVVLYEMVTWCTPFYGETPEDVIAAIVTEEPAPVTDHKPEVPAELAQIIATALRKDRAERYGSVNEMMEALKSFRRRLDVAAELATQPPWRRWIRSPGFALAALLVAALAVSLSVFWPRTRPAAAESIASIAVLPFENLSEDKANAYFADGIQDEILTRLAKIDDLKVISRTSTQRYKSSPENLPEIAKRLGIAHVLEGSVQKAGEQVRVTVQLIQAATDTHVWAETYERKLTDIFAVESDIAENIAKALRTKLTPGEQQAVAAKPTDNAEAYDAYLRGLALGLDLNFSPETRQKEAEFHSRAVQLDPKFAVAWAALSAVQTLIYAEFDPTPERLAEAKRFLDTAFKLQPDLGDAHYALGLYRYRGLRDYDGALSALQAAIDRGSNKALCLEFSAYVKRRQGRWEDALALHPQSEKLDPLNIIIFSEWAHTNRALRRLAEARALLDRALEITPNNPLLLTQKAETFQAEGDFESAERVLAHLPFDAQQRQLIEARCMQWACTRRFGEIVRVLEGVLATSESVPKHLIAVYRQWLGFARIGLGDRERAAVDLQQAREHLEALRERSDNGEGFLNELLVVDALLGDKTRVDLNAAKLGSKITGDAYEGPVFEQFIAAARAQLREPDEAIEILQRLIEKPGGVAVTRALLRADPIWDPLRNDQRFQRLISGPEP